MHSTPGWSSLPHGYPFRFLDRIPATADQPALLRLSLNARYGIDGVYPASLAIEIMAQAAIVLLAGPHGEPIRSGYLTGIDDARLHGPLLAGMTLVAGCETEARFGRMLRVRCRLEADGQPWAEGRLLLALNPDP